VVTHLRAYYGTDLDPSSYMVWNFLQDCFTVRHSEWALRFLHTIYSKIIKNLAEQISIIKRIRKQDLISEFVRILRSSGMWRRVTG